MFSQTVEYALRAMVYLAAARESQCATSEVIAEQTRVSPGYLSKVLRDLVLADLIVSHRGPRGGFALAQPAASITILDVVDAVDPIRRIERCPLDNPTHDRLCALHSRLDRALAEVRRTLGQTTLAEILAGLSPPGGEGGGGGGCQGMHGQCRSRCGNDHQAG
jgi:Rrf2 family protein